MGVALVLEAPRKLAYVEEPDRALQPSEVRLKTLFSGISAGTEMTQYRGTSPHLTKRWDADRRLFVPADATKPAYPVTSWGYEECGEIVEVGSAVKDLSVGQRVSAPWGHRSMHVAEAAWCRDRLLPANVDPISGIFCHIGCITLNGILDAKITLGETVVVFGLGVIGQVLAQMARLSGARVIGVDLNPARLQMAKRLGADVVLDPKEGPVAERVKDLTNGRGADVCIESSGAHQGLHEAIRSAAYSSKVVALGFYQGEAKGLSLGEEFHHNRIELICSQISGQSPELQHRWNRARLISTFSNLLAEKKIDMKPLVSHVEPFEQAAKLYKALDEQANDVMQAVMSFGTK